MGVTVGSSKCRSSLILRVSQIFEYLYVQNQKMVLFKEYGLSPEWWLIEALDEALDGLGGKWQSDLYKGYKKESKIVWKSVKPSRACSRSKKSNLG